MSGGKKSAPHNACTTYTESTWKKGCWLQHPMTGCPVWVMETGGTNEDGTKKPITYTDPVTEEVIAAAADCPKPEKIMNMQFTAPADCGGAPTPTPTPVPTPVPTPNPVPPTPTGDCCPVVVSSDGTVSVTADYTDPDAPVYDLSAPDCCPVVVSSDGSINVAVDSSDPNAPVFDISKECPTVQVGLNDGSDNLASLFPTVTDQNTGALTFLVPPPGDGAEPICCIQLCKKEPGEDGVEVIKVTLLDPETGAASTDPDDCTYLNTDGTPYTGDTTVLEDCVEVDDPPPGCVDPLASLVDIPAEAAIDLAAICGGGGGTECTGDLTFTDLGDDFSGTGYAWDNDSGYPAPVAQTGGPVLPASAPMCATAGELFVFEVTYSRHWATEEGGAFTPTPDAALAACLDMGTWTQQARVGGHFENGTPTIYTEVWTAVATGSCCGNVDLTGTYVDVGGTGLNMGQVVWHGTSVGGIDPAKLSAAGNGIASVQTFNAETNCNGGTGSTLTIDQSSDALVIYGGRHIHCEDTNGDGVVISGVDVSPMAENYENPDATTGICLDVNCNIVQGHFAMVNDGSDLSIMGDANGACGASERLTVVAITFDPCPEDTGGGGGSAVLADVTVDLLGSPCETCPDTMWTVQSAFDGLQFTGTLGAGAEYTIDVCFDGSTTPATSMTLASVDGGDFDETLQAVNGPSNTIGCGETASTSVQIKLTCVNHVDGSSIAMAAGTASQNP